MATSTFQDVQGCAMCCSCASTPVCSSQLQLQVQPLPGAGRLTLPKLITLRKSSGKKQLRKRAVTRSLYSSLVEGFGSTQRPFSYDLNTKSSFRKLNDPGISPSSQQQEQSGVAEDKLEEGNLYSQAPVASAYGDGAHAETLADIGHDIDMKRSARARPPSMSLSQGFSPHGRRSVSHTTGPAGYPLSTAQLPGTMGFVMAFSVAALGLKTAVEKQVFLTGAPQKVCEKCEGYGVQQCHVCQGRGVLTWEGKLRHTDPCPLCFGSCLKKCQNCGGAKMRKGMPPDMISKFQLKAGLNKK